MNKVKTVKVKNEDGSISEESYSIAADALNIDMVNGKNVQETIGTIDVDKDGDIAAQLNKKINKSDIIDNLNSSDNNKVLSAKQGKVLNEAVAAANSDIKKKIYYFNTVADMKANEDLVAGDTCQTLGYHSVNDGGSGVYKIVSSTAEDDGGSIHILDNGLRAELVVKDNINVMQFGAKGDGITDDSIAIQTALSKPYNVKFNKKNYLIGTSIALGPGRIIDFNWCTLITTDGVTAFTINKNNGTNIYTYITLKNVFVNMEHGGNFIEDINCYNITYDNIRLNRLRGSNFGFKITNGFNHRFLNIWINGMSDNADTLSENNASGIIYDIDGNTSIQGITNVTNTTFKDCLIQKLYNGIKFDRTGTSGSYDTTFIENIGFSSCDKCINVNTNVLYDVNIQTIRCEWSDYALYIGKKAYFIVNNFFSNGTQKAIYNNDGNIIFGGFFRADSQQKSNCYIIDNNTGKISFENCIELSNVGMVEFNPNITSEPIVQMDNVKLVTNNIQSIRLHTFKKIHYVQTNYLNFTNISNLRNGMEFTVTNARDSGSLTLPDNTYLLIGETVKCYVINDTIKYYKLI